MTLSLPPLEEILGIAALKMEQTQQNPRWHGEGSVLAHTKLVCEALEKLPAFQSAEAETRQILYLAALLHDIGKIRTTRLEDGRWISPGHSRVSAEMARQLLWQDLGLCGTPEKQRFRETVCLLARYHSVPLHAITQADGERTLRRIAANGATVPGFTVELLCTLAEADVLGRICGDRDELLEQIQLCRELAKEAACLTGPYRFPSGHTQYAYLSGRNVPAEYELYPDTWGEVILLSGLPGTGKDTWISENCPDLPMISLDEIRREIKISPMENQSRVVDMARERAREFLRKKQPFVWNATNITPLTRQKQVDLFTAYGASVRIVYLETTWDRQIHRNAGRADAVPEAVLCDMLDKLSPPERFEAHRVDWLCV